MVNRLKNNPLPTYELQDLKKNWVRVECAYVNVTLLNPVDALNIIEKQEDRYALG